MHRKVGDLHNFGKYVAEIELDGTRGFEKPRSVFWEYLFFSRQSPLTKLFASSDVRDLIFSLDILKRTDSHGLIRAVDTVEIGKTDLFRFGALLAYSFSFGIQDLHKENVILAEHGPLPVDVEVVFSRLVLPDETHLLKRRSSEFDQVSFLGSINSNPNELQEDELRDLLGGFIQMILLIASKAKAITSILDEAVRTESTHVKVRTLLRPTKVYREHLDSSSGFEFLPSEKLQLDRGDVPYFFKFLGQSGVYFMNSENTYSAVELDPLVQKVEKVSAVSPSSILSKESLIDQALPRAILYLLKHHADAKWRGEIQIGDLLMESRDNGFIFRNGSRTYEAKR